METVQIYNVLGKIVKICTFWVKISLPIISIFQKEYSPVFHSFISSLKFLLILLLLGQWADPCGTAMPGQLVTEPEQAPQLYPLIKISLISKGEHAPRIRY